MIALIGNLHLLEVLSIAGAALLVFGKRLPEVAVRGAGQLVRLRRSVMRMWREAGLEEELRRVRQGGLVDGEPHRRGRGAAARRVNVP